MTSSAVESIHGGIGLGVQAAKARIALAVHLKNVDAERRERLGEVGLPGTVERVDDHAQVRRADRLGIDHSAQVLEIRTDEVDQLKLAASSGRVGQQFGLDAVGELHRRGAAVGHAQLEAQILGGVVARGQHDAAHSRVVTSDREAECRRGQVTVGHLHDQAVTGHDLRCGSCEAAGLEARVVADEDRAAGVLGSEHAGGSIGDAAQ